MRVTVGRIGKPHGLRGDVTVELRTDEPERCFVVGGTLLTETGPLVLESVRWSARPVMKFVGVDDRTAAERWRDVLLEIEREPLARPEDPDEYYDHQLVGLSVHTSAGPLGDVVEVIHLPGQDLLAVRRDGAGDVLIPFVAEVVTAVDIDAGRVDVELPEGLLDL
jgi:16S rRNA processing protein RimM